MLPIIREKPLKNLGYQGGVKFFFSQCDLLGHPVLNVKLYHCKLYAKQHCTIKIEALNCDPVKTYLFDIDNNIFEKLFDTWTFDSYLTVIQSRVREKYKKFRT